MVEGACYLEPTCVDGSAPVEGYCTVPWTCENGADPVGGKCTVPWTCPNGSPPVNGFCIIPWTCPNAATPVNGKCVVPWTCQDGSTPVDGKCYVPWTCKNGSAPVVIDSKFYCESTPICQVTQHPTPDLCACVLTNMIVKSGQCCCKDGTEFIDGSCKAKRTQPPWIANCSWHCEKRDPCTNICIDWKDY